MSMVGLKALSDGIARPLLCARCSCRQRKTTNLNSSSNFRRSVSSTAARQAAPPLKLAIVGAGPSGFYTASRVLASLPPDSPSGKDVEVHMYERLPTPYGLVRYGVAPDHPEVKHKFDELAKDPRFKYFGNVLLTSQPSVPSASTPSLTNTWPSEELRMASKPPLTALSSYSYPHALKLPLPSLLPHYNALLLSYGASLSNPLTSVAGSSSSTAPLGNVFPALALVGWYNGHPAFTDLPVDLRGTEEVAVIGHGNVALDVARILLKDVRQLKSTDLPDEILHVLSQSSVKAVTATGRRGPGQVAFTTKEFREITGIPGVAFKGVQGELMDQAKEAVKGDRMRTRLLGLMEKENKYLDGDKAFQLDFLKSPNAFLPGFNVSDEASELTSNSSKVHSVEWTVNQLLPAAPEMPAPPISQESSVPHPSPSARSMVARATNERVRSRADLVVESVGYRSEPIGALDGSGDMLALPFDNSRGRVRNVGGRVTATDGVVIPGLYAAGWVARGPVGVIASTMHDAYSIADQILADHFDSPTPKQTASPSSSTFSPLANASARPQPGLPEDVSRGLRDGKVVDLEKWDRIDAAERERGKKGGKGKEREKFRKVEEMLAVLR